MLIFFDKLGKQHNIKINFTFFFTFLMWLLQNVEFTIRLGYILCDSAACALVYLTKVKWG